MRYFILSISLFLMACGTQKSQTNLKNVSDYINIVSPPPFGEVSETLIITGEARGVYFFEGDFPVEIITEDGNKIDHYATAQGEWMTEDFVPFRFEYDISDLAPQEILVKFHRNNPSDDRSLDMVLELPLIITK